MLVLSQRRISFSVDGLVGPEFPRLSGRVGFTLLQFQIARSIRLHPYNALAFAAPIAVFVSVLFTGGLWEIDLAIEVGPS